MTHGRGLAEGHQLLTLPGSTHVATLVTPTHGPVIGKRTRARHVLGAVFRFTYGLNLQAFELAILLASVTCNLLHHSNQRK